MLWHLWCEEAQPFQSHLTMTQETTTHTRTYTHTSALCPISISACDMWAVYSEVWHQGIPFTDPSKFLSWTQNTSVNTHWRLKQNKLHTKFVSYSLSPSVSHSHTRTHTHTPEQWKGEPRRATWLAWERKKGSYANNGHHSDTMLTFSDGGLISFSMLLIGPEQTATKPQVPHHTQKSVS